MAAKTKTIQIICGPTASGKSAFALQCAEKHNGVIINADSMQIYDAIPTLTAQPSAEEQTQHPHRLYAALRPSEHCSAARWTDLAKAEIEACFGQDQTPIITGGTGFYIQALTQGLSPLPDIAPETRQYFMERQESEGTEALYAELQNRDPDMAARLKPNDKQRIIRALETLEQTGKSLRYWQGLPKDTPPDNWEFEITLVMPERDVLYERCNRRFEKMLDDDSTWEDIKTLKHQIDSGDVPADAQITNALGFSWLCDYLDGQCDLNTAIQKAQQETRNYAKRQITWFKHQLN